MAPAGKLPPTLVIFFTYLIKYKYRISKLWTHRELCMWLLFMIDQQQDLIYSLTFLLGSYIALTFLQTPKTIYFHNTY